MIMFRIKKSLQRMGSGMKNSYSSSLISLPSSIYLIQGFFWIARDSSKLSFAGHTFSFSGLFFLSFDSSLLGEEFFCFLQYFLLGLKFSFVYLRIFLVFGLGFEELGSKFCFYGLSRVRAGFFLGLPRPLLTGTCSQVFPPVIYLLSNSLLNVRMFASRASFSLLPQFLGWRFPQGCTYLTGFLLQQQDTTQGYNPSKSLSHSWETCRSSSLADALACLWSQYCRQLRLKWVISQRYSSTVIILLTSHISLKLLELAMSRLQVSWQDKQSNEYIFGI